MKHTSTEIDNDLAQGYWMNNTAASKLSENLLWNTGTGLKSSLPDMMKFIAYSLS